MIEKRPELDNFEAKLYGLLTKYEVKIYGWILAKFFFCVFMDQDGVKVYTLAKEGKRPISVNNQPS